MKLSKAIVCLAASSVAPCTARVPARKLGGPPEEAGIVKRGEDGWVNSLGDDKSGLRSFTGISAKELCTSILEGEEPNTDEVSFQKLLKDNVANLVKGDDIYAEVWDLDDLGGCASVIECCPFFLRLEPIATGTVKLTYIEKVKGQIEFNTYSAHGTLTGEDGALYKFNEHITVSIEGSSFSIKKEKVHLVGPI